MVPGFELTTFETWGTRIYFDLVAIPYQASHVTKMHFIVLQNNFQNNPMLVRVRASWIH